jgi:transcriptional regulator with XRE-family HTH domain
MDKAATHELKMFGEGLRRHRQALGVSQEDFAELCDLHRTYVGQVERGEKNISYENISRIARALDMKVSALFRSAEL